jgi:hypothetical protein
MKRIIILTIFCFLLFSGKRFICNEIEVKLTCFQQEVPVGAPVFIGVEIKNISGKPMTLSFKHETIKTEIRDEKGNLVEQDPQRKILDMPALDSMKMDIPADWKDQKVRQINYLTTPQKYSIKVILSSKGPYYFKNEKGELQPFSAWEGKVESNECYVTVVTPKGIDKEAYEYFKGSPLSNPTELLKNYPTSTYAAYLIYDRLRGFAQADFTNPRFLKSLETGVFLSNSYPTEAGWIWFKGEDNAAWWSKWAEVILKNHPDIWFADELRLKVAINQVALKKYKEGEAELEKLSKETKPYIAEKAEKFLDLMKQKGWITESRTKADEQTVPASKTSPTETK